MKKIPQKGGGVRAVRATSAKRNVIKQRQVSLAEPLKAWVDLAKAGRPVTFDLGRVNVFPPETIQNMVKFCRKMEREENRKHART